MRVRGLTERVSRCVTDRPHAQRRASFSETEERLRCSSTRNCTGAEKARRDDFPRKQLTRFHSVTPAGLWMSAVLVCFPLYFLPPQVCRRCRLCLPGSTAAGQCTPCTDSHFFWRGRCIVRLPDSLPAEHFEASPVPPCVPAVSVPPSAFPAFGPMTWTLSLRATGGEQIRHFRGEEGVRARAENARSSRRLRDAAAAKHLPWSASIKAMSRPPLL